MSQNLVLHSGLVFHQYVVPYRCNGHWHAVCQHSFKGGAVPDGNGPNPSSFPDFRCVSTVRPQEIRRNIIFPRPSFITGLSRLLPHAMFGLIISGRPVDATPQGITETQFAFRIPPAPHFSHIVVFILPGTQLPPDTAATVYVQIPPSQEFKLLGGIGPGKESAIFKVNGIKSGNDADRDAMTDNDPSTAPSGIPAGGDIVVGISIEPAAQVEQQLLNLKSSGSQPADGGPSTAMVKMSSGPGVQVSTKVLAQRIIGNAFNFLASFGSDTVPLKAFQDWWLKFEKKVELDPSFLEREQG